MTTLDTHELCDILNTNPDAECALYLDADCPEFQFFTESLGGGLFAARVVYYSCDPESGPDLDEVDVLFDGTVDAIGGRVVLS